MTAAAAGIALAVALVGGTPAISQAQGDTTAVAINTKDGSSVFRLAFNIRKVTGDVVDLTKRSNWAPQW